MQDWEMKRVFVLPEHTLDTGWFSLFDVTRIRFITQQLNSAVFLGEKLCLILSLPSFSPF